MIATEIYRTFSQYNSWINPKLLEACSKLSDEERKRDVRVPFKSIHGLWNHILLTNRGWMARFDGKPFPYPALDLTLYEDWDELGVEITKTDNDIQEFVANLTPERLAGTLTLIPMSNPTPITLPFYGAVMQLFNHQTHHRGQITAVLEQLGGDCGVMDLGAMPGLRL